VVPARYNRAAAQERAQCRNRHEERRSRPEPLRLGKRPSTPQVVLADNRVRDACAGIHEGSKLRSARGDAWHYSGVIEKIPYLRNSESTAVELMPVFQFRRTRLPERARQLLGLAPVSFFAPHQAYSSRQDPLVQSTSFPRHGESTAPGRHRVILDVVFHHTAEGDDHGRRCVSAASRTGLTTCLRDRNLGTQTIPAVAIRLNANHPVVRRVIEDSLHYWVQEMHIDGFRFDLASVLSRDLNGYPLPKPADFVGYRI